jgi:hypothetical protein
MICIIFHYITDIEQKQGVYKKKTGEEAPLSYTKHKTPRHATLPRLAQTN